MMHGLRRNVALASKCCGGGTCARAVMIANACNNGFGEKDGMGRGKGSGSTRYTERNLVVVLAVVVVPSMCFERTWCRKVILGLASSKTCTSHR